MPDELVAVFSDPDAASRALRSLRALGVTGAQVASPAPYPAVNQTGHPGPWRALSWIALCGGLTGLSVAAALEVLTSKWMGLQVGGKPIVAWTAFGVVLFELTMLFAGLSNFTALVLLSAIARRRMSQRARDQVGSERIVLVVPGQGLAEPRLQEVRYALVGLSGEVLP